MTVYGAHSSGGLMRGGAVAVGDREDVPAGGSDAAKRILLPVAVLGDTGHREGMKRLDHERSKTGQWKAAISVHAPHDALRSEPAAVGRVFGDRAREGARHRFHVIQVRRRL